MTLYTIMSHNCCIMHVRGCYNIGSMFATRISRRIQPRIQPHRIIFTKQPSNFVRNHSKMSDQSHAPLNLPKDSSVPGEQFEVRSTSNDEDWKPNPSKSIPLSPARQRLVDDIIELYSCHPTIERVKRYTPDCVYDDQFVYANDRYKVSSLLLLIGIMY